MDPSPTPQQQQVITLIGPENATVDVLSVFIDLGALVSRPSLVLSVRGQVDTSRAGHAAELAYSAAGAATVFRRVTVVDPCAARRPLPSRFCPGLSAPGALVCATCLDASTCLCLSPASAAPDSSSSSAAAAAFAPPSYVLPPTVNVRLGDGGTLEVAGGSQIVTNVVVMGSAWKDPGATASVRSLHLSDTASHVYSACPVASPAWMPVYPRTCKAAASSPAAPVPTASGDPNNDATPPLALLLRLQDPIDGDLTSSLSATVGLLGPVSTAAATEEGRPFLIRYAVTNRGGLSSAPATRRVVVVNPCKDPREHPCPDGSGQCSEGGLCGGLPAAQPAAAPNSPPVITLLGGASARITAGDRFDACPASAPLAAVCFRGAAASDQEDGLLTPQLAACAPGAEGITTEADRLSKYGLAGCFARIPVAASAAARDGGGGNGSASSPPPLAATNKGVWTAPGEYTLTLSVRDSRGSAAAANFTLRVSPACATPERLCPDLASCSVGGACVGADGIGGGGGGASSLLGASPEPTAPSISLVSSAAYGTAVTVRRFSSLAACAPGAQPSADAPCDPGATAAEADGTDITYRVLSCPPEDCLPFGCPGHEFATKGLAGCVDTAAAEGTVFAVRFVVFGTAGFPPPNASAVRTVAIGAPCPPGQAYCGGACAAVPDCSVLDAFETAQQPPPPPAAAAPPKLTVLLPPAFEVVFGEAAACPPPPAAAAAAAAAPPGGAQLSWPACAARSQADGGRGEDLSDSVAFSQVLGPAAAANATNSSASPQLACAFASLSVPGVCLPGTYRYRASVTPAATTANSSATPLPAAVAYFAVRVVEVALVTVSRLVQAAAGDAAGAALEAALLLNASSPESRNLSATTADAVCKAIGAACLSARATVASAAPLNITSSAPGGGGARQINVTLRVSVSSAEPPLDIPPPPPAGASSQQQSGRKLLGPAGRASLGEATNGTGSRHEGDVNTAAMMLAFPHQERHQRALAAAADGAAAVATSALLAAMLQGLQPSRMAQQARAGPATTSKPKISQSLYELLLGCCQDLAPIKFFGVVVFKSLHGKFTP